MSFVGVYVLHAAMVLCLLGQACGEKYIVILKIELTIENPYFVCRCEVEGGRPKHKEFVLKRETTSLGDLHYCKVDDEFVDAGSCSCKFCWPCSEDEMAEKDFVVYDRHIATTYASMHPLNEQTGSTPGANSERYIIWLVKRDGVYPYGGNDPLYIWSKKKDYQFDHTLCAIH